MRIERPESPGRRATIAAVFAVGTVFLPPGAAVLIGALRARDPGAVRLSAAGTAGFFDFFSGTAGFVSSDAARFRIGAAFLLAGSNGWGCRLGFGSGRFLLSDMLQSLITDH
jgi:hypothetical protein